MPTWTKDDIARIIIRVGRDMGISPRGIVIGLSVGLVESNLTVYANAKVAGSLALPHDAVGSDGMSVGVQQQQVVMGNGWWWGAGRTMPRPHLVDAAVLRPTCKAGLQQRRRGRTRPSRPRQRIPHPLRRTHG